MIPAYQQANKEKDELREKLEDEKQQCRELKSELERLEQEY